MASPNRRDSPSGSASRPVPSSRRSSSSNANSATAGDYPRAETTARLGSPIPRYGSPSARQLATPREQEAEESGGTPSPLAGLSGVPSSSLPGPAESALANALRGAAGRSPPRFHTPERGVSPARAAELGRGPVSNYGSFEPRSYTGSPAPYEDHRIVARHLAGPTAASSSANLSDRYARGRGDGSKDRDRSTSVAPGIDEDEFSSLRLQGGDVTRGIYRWAEQEEAKVQQGVQRSKSFSEHRPRPEDETMDIHQIKRPGGFRRDHLRRLASPSPTRGEGSRAAQLRGRPQLPTTSFLEFLTLYGHFAGEDLGDDDEDESDDYLTSEAEPSLLEPDEDGLEATETSRLLTPRKSRRERAKTGGSGSMGAALLLLKSFVGTGVLFMPRAYLNGGMLFSILVLLFIAALSYYCFILLVRSRLACPSSFGGMGKALYGKWLKNLINFSLVISQIGFSSAYIVFVSENLKAFTLAVSKCRVDIDIKWMILLQMAIFLPLSLYRNITNLQKLALIADVFIVLGLVYLYYYDFLNIAQHGIADIAHFNKNSWTLFIGTAIFTFEGIGLIIPIQEGMKKPEKFPRVLAIVMVIITVIFVSMGAFSYAAYGSQTKTVIILNLPQDNKMVNGVQFIYSLAILLSTPLQFFPAIEITSQAIFKRGSGKRDWTIKWKKNVFRFLMVVFCAMIAWVGANDLDKFVALVGSFACVPLVYIYP